MSAGQAPSPVERELLRAAVSGALLSAIPAGWALIAVAATALTGSLRKDRRR